MEDSFRRLDDTKFNLLVFGQGAVPRDDFGLGEMLVVHAIPADPLNDKELARAGIPSVSYYLLRPDGHVGLCGTSPSAASIAGYVAGRLRAGR